MAEERYCPQCGYLNLAGRGACLMCYARIGQAGGGRQCPQCACEVFPTSRFCARCGEALVAGAQAPPATAAPATSTPPPGVPERQAQEVDETEEEEMFVPPSPGLLAEEGPPPLLASETGDGFSTPLPPPGTMELDDQEPAAKLASDFSGWELEAGEEKRT